LRLISGNVYCTARESGAAQDPLGRYLSFPPWELPDFSRDKVGSQTFDQFNQRGISHHGNLTDVLVMVAYQLEMSDQGPKTLPTSELGNFNDHASKATASAILTKSSAASADVGRI